MLATSVIPPEFCTVPGPASVLLESESAPLALTNIASVNVTVFDTIESVCVPLAPPRMIRATVGLATSIAMV